MENSYRFLQGRAGVSGHVRSERGGQQLTVRGMKGAAESEVYCWRDGNAQCIARGKTDESGQIRFSFLPEGALFVAAVGKVILWEKDGSGESYFHACAMLRKAEREKEKTSAAEGEDPRLSVSEKMEIPPEKIAKTAKEEVGEELRNSETEEEAAWETEYALRQGGDSPGVDALPEIVFPGRAAALKRYFLSSPSIIPFDAPGWRFVRVPSPLPGAAYCVLGYLARNGRAEKIAYAVPGTPYHPPAQLPGYRYHGGYWMMIQETTDE